MNQDYVMHDYSAYTTNYNSPDASHSWTQQAAYHDQPYQSYDNGAQHYSAYGSHTIPYQGLDGPSNISQNYALVVSKSVETCDQRIIQISPAENENQSQYRAEDWEDEYMTMYMQNGKLSATNPKSEPYHQQQQYSPPEDSALFHGSTKQDCRRRKPTFPPATSPLKNPAVLKSIKDEGRKRKRSYGHIRTPSGLSGSVTTYDPVTDNYYVVQNPTSPKGSGGFGHASYQGPWM